MSGERMTLSYYGKLYHILSPGTDRLVKVKVKYKSRIYVLMVIYILNLPLYCIPELLQALELLHITSVFYSAASCDIVL